MGSGYIPDPLGRHSPREPDRYGRLVPPPADDHTRARGAVTDAGELLLELRRRPGLHPETMRADGDWQAHKLIVELLKNERPDDAVLSEEGADNPIRVGYDRVWI